jgi:hypothetical protein
MNFTPKTVAMLKSFSAINSGILFQPGDTLKTMSTAKTLMAKAKLDQMLPKACAIHDLPRFINVVGLFKNPDLEFNDSSILIRSDNQKVEYKYADPKVVVAPPTNDPSLPSVDVQFSLSSDHLKNVLQASTALGTKNLAFVGDGEKITVECFSLDGAVADVFSLEIGPTAKKFRFVFKIEYLKILPRTYEISIAAKGLALFKAEDIEYFAALDSKASSFEG